MKLLRTACNNTCMFCVRISASNCVGLISHVDNSYYNRYPGSARTGCCYYLHHETQPRPKISWYLMTAIIMMVEKSDSYILICLS